MAASTIKAEINHSLLSAYRATMRSNALTVLVSFMLSVVYLLRARRGQVDGRADGNI